MNCFLNSALQIIIRVGGFGEKLYQKIQEVESKDHDFLQEIDVIIIVLK